MSHRHDPVRVSRRAALGAAAAAGAALGSPLGSHGNVLAGPAEPDGHANNPYYVAEQTDMPEVAPAPTTPGTRYASIAGTDFKPSGDGAAYTTEHGDLRSSTAAPPYTARVALPHGARITEMVVYATRPDSPSSTIVRLVCHRSSLADSTAFVTVAMVNTGPVAPSPLVRTLTAPVSAATNGAIVDESAAAYFVIANLPTNVAHPLWGVRIGYVTADAGRFFPIDPIRAYDSRAAIPDPGLLGPNTSRLILVRDSRANGSGAVLTSDVVPLGARAIACNLTVSGTTGPNFLALTPGDAASFTTSAINWSAADQSVANGLIAKLDANRFVRVWCGDQPGSTHVILDVNGYWI